MKKKSYFHWHPRVGAKLTRNMAKLCYGYKKDTADDIANTTVCRVLFSLKSRSYMIYFSTEKAACFSHKPVNNTSSNLISIF